MTEQLQFLVFHSFFPIFPPFLSFLPSPSLPSLLTNWLFHPLTQYILDAMVGPFLPNFLACKKLCWISSYKNLTKFFNFSYNETSRARQSMTGMAIFYDTIKNLDSLYSVVFSVWFLSLRSPHVPRWLLKLQPSYLSSRVLYKKEKGKRHHSHPSQLSLKRLPGSPTQWLLLRL